MVEPLHTRLESLAARGVVVVDPRQTYLDEQVDLGRICPGAVLHPGTRLSGARIFIGPGAKIGTEGPASLVQSVIGPDAEIASGYVEGAVLLRAAKIGGNGHVRPACLLEEEASTAHAVGLKHTILMSFVTLGSLINLCDALLAGGTSRADHTEVGSGFIHFNFTPWGKRGDKATSSLVGDVVHGVFLRQPRVFLGGLSGMVGPQKIGFGALTVAGQVIRAPVPAGRIHGDVARRVDTAFRSDLGDWQGQDIARLNKDYIGQLVALRAWYEQVRLARIPATPEHATDRIVIQEAMRVLDSCVDERVKRLNAFLEERGLTPLTVTSDAPLCPLDVTPDGRDHVDWVRGLNDAQIETGIAWLQTVAQGVHSAASRNFSS
ncbi:MAG: UDP-N-acetylglucosamine pyrophosphorylase [Alphaproteobacteria bacterium]|nr:MAG: UDP-N-acetylglucosamine pyrophosphorylase [Alphaproteobacteria bacterium]